MVNTNGIRIAKDVEFVRRLATYMPDFELYLQFDSFEQAAETAKGIMIVAAIGVLLNGLCDAVLFGLPRLTR